MSKDEKRTELDVLFPDKKITLSDGSVVTIKPLVLPDLPKVAAAFSKLMKRSEKMKVADPVEMALLGMEELFALLPFCIDRKPEEILAADAAEVLQIILQQNITDAAVGKWSALADMVTKRFGGLSQSVASKRQ